jgi:hypothetical protein
VDYWPPSPTVPPDPFTDASGADLFAVNYAALAAVVVRTPRLLMLDRDGRYLDADTALVEDAGALRLEALLEREPAASVAGARACRGCRAPVRAQQWMLDLAEWNITKALAAL